MTLERERGAPGRKLFSVGWVLAVLALAVAPSLGTLAAPLISDDGAALGYVHREGPLVDWSQPQYGMRIVRFWRPLVTTSLDLQEASTGTAAAPLRLFNLAGHALAAVLAGLLARRLGAGAAGALLAGALAATFPDQGGTVTWIVGRVDSMTVPLVLAALWLALARAPAARLAAAGVALLACASKEVAAVAPLAGLLLALGRRDAGAGPGARLRGALAAALPLALGAGVALCLRRAALGVWIGGYPAPELGPAGLARAGAGVLRALALPLGAGLLGLLLAGARRTAWRALAAGLAAAAVCLLPLVPLLAGGMLEEQNRRVLFLTEALVAVALGGALRVAPGPRALAALLPLLAAVLVRAGLARADTGEWAASARAAEAHVEAVRAALSGAGASLDPVLDPGAARIHGGAYCLAWGVADRFRAPFEPAPRPVWPLRVMFAERIAGERDVAPATAPVAGLVDPFGGAPRAAPELAVTVGGSADFGPLVLDVAVAQGGGPLLELPGDHPGPFELVVYTELGYESATWQPERAGDAAPALRLTLGEALRLRGVASLGDALLQAADTGSTRAYLELRAIPAGGAGGPPLAASRLLPLVWEPDLLARLGVGD